jgi:hypothetical protein
VVQDTSRLLPGPSTCLRTSSLCYVGRENFMPIIFKKMRKTYDILNAMSFFSQGKKLSEVCMCPYTGLQTVNT